GGCASHPRLWGPGAETARRGGHRGGRPAGAPGRGHDRDDVRSAGRRAGRPAGRRAEAPVRVRPPRRRGSQTRHQPGAPRRRGRVADGHDVAVVVTRADKRRGRGSALVPSPVKAAALELSLPVTEQVDDLLDAGVELGVVVAFGRLVKPHVLDRVPMVNVHFSLLPRWRGAAPVERAILAGDTETGVCLMGLEEGLDTGPVYECVPVGIGPEETADELRGRLVETGADLLVRRLREGLGVPV